MIKEGDICKIVGDCRYVEGTRVVVLKYLKSSNEFLIRPLEGMTQCCVKPEVLEVVYESDI